MKSEMQKISKLESIPDMHRMLDLPGPVHPLITLIDRTKGQIDMSRLPASYVSGFYKISFISKLGGKFKYGQGFMILTRAVSCSRHQTRSWAVWEAIGIVKVIR